MPVSWGGAEKRSSNGYIDHQWVKWFDSLGYDFYMKRHSGMWTVSVWTSTEDVQEPVQLAESEPRDILPDALLDVYNQIKILKALSATVDSSGN